MKFKGKMLYKSRVDSTMQNVTLQPLPFLTAKCLKPNEPHTILHRAIWRLQASLVPTYLGTWYFTTKYTTVLNDFNAEQVSEVYVLDNIIKIMHFFRNYRVSS